MAHLDWIGKRAVLNHHREIPFRLLRCDPKLSVGDPDAGNLLVQGDNLHALKALLPHYAARVKCVYIDPPYNTGNEGWSYNDNSNAPEIKAWLGKVVGKEAEDLSRHDKWLCMMYPRLSLLREFLTDDGAIFISIDDNEVHTLRMLCDEIFGANQRVGTIVWKNVTDNNPTNIASEHEYILCYARKKDCLPKAWKSTNLAVKEKLLEIEREFIETYPDQKRRQAAYSKWFTKNKSQLWPFQDYKFIDGGGIYTGMRSVHNPGKEGYRYDVPHPVTGKACVEPMMGYRFPESTMQELLAQGRIIFGEDETKLVELKVYAKDYRSKLSSLFELDGRVGTNEVKSIFLGEKRPFDFPKPTELIEELLSFTTSGNDIILDSFAGSGTTAHSVMKLNSQDGQNRRFITIEMDETIALQTTQERLRRVCEGYTGKKGAIAGLSSGFRFCRLSEPLFDAYGSIRPEVKFADLAAHIYFTETGSPMPRRRENSPLLGVHNGLGIYLLFNGILGDKRPEAGNILTPDVLDDLPPHKGTRVIYGEGTTLGPMRLRTEGIVFKQVPYQVRTR